MTRLSTLVAHCIGATSLFALRRLEPGPCKTMPCSFRSSRQCRRLRPSRCGRSLETLDPILAQSWSWSNSCPVYIIFEIAWLVTGTVWLIGVDPDPEMCDKTIHVFSMVFVLINFMFIVVTNFMFIKSLFRRWLWSTSGSTSSRRSSSCSASAAPRSAPSLDTAPIGTSWRCFHILLVFPF